MPDDLDDIFHEFNRREIEEDIKHIAFSLSKDKDILPLYLDKDIDDLLIAFSTTADIYQNFKIRRMPQIVETCKKTLSLLEEIICFYNQKVEDYNKKSYLYKFFNKCKDAYKLSFYEKTYKDLNFLNSCQSYKFVYIGNSMEALFLEIEAEHQSMFPKTQNQNPYR